MFAIGAGGMCAALISVTCARRLEAADLGWLQEHLCERAISGSGEPSQLGLFPACSFSKGRWRLPEQSRLSAW